MSAWAITAAGVALAILVVVILAVIYQLGAGRRRHRARQMFFEHRDALRQDYFRCAAAGGKPKGLRWKECEWEDWVEFTRHRPSGELVALASLTIHFEAVEGGDMEDVDAVGLPRNATAVFFFREGRWQTLGKAVFNKNPDEAADHFRAEYERLPPE